MVIDYERDQRNRANVIKREARGEGLIRGRREGIQQEKRSFVLSLIKDTDFNDERIAYLAAVEESFVRKIRAGK